MDQRTFVNHRHFQRDADDAHQICSGNQRAQDGSDTQCFTFTRIDQLKDTQVSIILLILAALR